ncbi:hypothetical protein LSUE1_G009712, partial [Lachnellula suecica]
RYVPISDRASKSLAEASLPGEPRIYNTRSKRSGVPLITLYYRDYKRRSKEENAQGQQYFILSEEKALENAYLPLPLISPASVQRIKRPSLQAKTSLGASKSFKVIREVLEDQAINLENVYNIDETGVMLCMLGSIQVLIGKDNPRDYRGAGIKRTMVTAIEYISANSRSLLLMIPQPIEATRQCSLPLDGTMRAPSLGIPTLRLAWSGSSAFLIPKQENKLTRSRGY